MSGQSLEAGLVQRQGHQLVQSENIALAQDIRELLHDADHQADDFSLPSDTPEPPELEDAGDSYLLEVLQDVAQTFMLEKETASLLTQSHQLPRRAHPIVAVRIDADWSVHLQQGIPEEKTQYWRIIAEAIAVHLRRVEQPAQNAEGVILSKPGDWCHVPCLRKDDLLALVPIAQRETIKNKLAKLGSLLKLFAIRLPNGDVVSVSALIDEPRSGRRALAKKRATTAGALRLESERPARLAGERWSERDWKDFRHAQQKHSSKWKKKRGYTNNKDEPEDAPIPSPEGKRAKSKIRRPSSTKRTKRKPK